MQFIVLIIGLIGLLAVVIVGALWTMIMMMPMIVMIGVIVFFVVRAERKHAVERAMLKQAANRERILNEQEYAAWHKETEHARRKHDRRMSALRKFDDLRDPPTDRQS